MIAFPEGKKCAVCWSFDFDGISAWLGTHHLKTYQAIGRGEYAGRVAAERVLALLDKYDIQSTWFTPGHTAHTWPALTKAVADAGHEIAHHGYCHENPLELTRDEERDVLLRGIEALVEVTGQRPVGYRSPAWETSDNTVDLLVEEGFTYCSNGLADDFRLYKVRQGDVAEMDRPFQYGRESDLIEMPSAWHLSDLVILEATYVWPNRVAPNPAAAEQIWKDEFDYMYDNVPGGVITYPFHPEGIARGHRMLLWERVINHMLERGDVWFATQIDVARAWTPDPPGLWAQGSTYVPQA